MKLFLCVLYLFFSFAFADQARAEKRVALVIGNSAYQHTSKLTNPKNDATDISAALKAHGFQVLEGYDLDKSSFDRTVRDFSIALKGAEVGVFFYAGHGLQVAGQNYLLPIDATAEGAEAIDFEMVRVDLIHRTMERQTNTNILFLDACRDNPLARNLSRSMGTRSAEVGRGLAAVESGIGTLISYSTQPGNVALDGTGRNSPFAAALVKQLTGTGDDLSAILIAVRNDVMIATQRKQVPWEHSALTGRFYFGSPSQMAPRQSTEKLVKAEPAIDPTPRQTLPFDGSWLVRINCPKTADGKTQGYTRQLVARVDNGALHGEDGTKGRPLWMVLDGAIQSNGTAWMKVHGLTGSARSTLGALAEGSPFSYTVTGQFSGRTGTGKRDEGRECDLTFVKQ